MNIKEGDIVKLYNILEIIRKFIICINIRKGIFTHNGVKY